MTDLGGQAKVVASVARKPMLAIVLSITLHVAVMGGAVTWYLTHGPKPEPLSIELVVVSEGLDIDTPTPDKPSSNDSAVTQNTAAPPPSAAVSEPTAPAAPALPQAAPPPSDVVLPAPVPPLPVTPPTPVVKPAPPKPTPPKPAPTPPVVASQPTPSPSSTAPVGQSSAGLSGPAGGGDIAQLSAPAPVYPAEAKRRGQEGRVVVRAEIDTDGLPRNVAVETSSGFKALDDAAVEAVKTWRFRNGSGRSVEITAPIRFALRADEKPR